MTPALQFQAPPGAQTVTSLTARIRRSLEKEFPDVKVAGEISNVKLAASGHWYFTLKDERAEIRCVCFRQDALYLRTKPQHGLAVIARGRVSVYPKRGEYQLKVDALTPQGAGALQQEFERLKARLAAEGLFDESRKRPLPAMPLRIGVVTSPSGAVIADILRTLERRFAGLHVRLFPVRVQGSGAAREIVAGVRYFSDRPWAEVVIVGRGGGSLEELWPFNEEIVARAIAASKVPVVSAVGHETDFTMADFAADLRAATPSVAAERVVPESDAVLEQFRSLESQAARALELRLQRLQTRVLQAGLERAARSVRSRTDDAWQAADTAAAGLRVSVAEILAGCGSRLQGLERKLSRLDLRVRLVRRERRLDDLAQRQGVALRAVVERTKHSADTAAAGLRVSVGEILDRCGSRLEGLERRLSQLDLRVRLVRRERRLDDLTQRQAVALRAAVERRKAGLESASRSLAALSPLAILERGYAIVTSQSGTPVTDCDQVEVDDRLAARLHRGKLTVRVEGSAPPDPESTARSFHGESPDRRDL